MKKTGVLLLMVSVISLFCGCAKQEIPEQAASEARGITITFPYKKQGGFSSNQFAVWVEDAEGNLVKTLYATDFTAKGGWEKRPQALPVWVERAGLRNQTAEVLEGIAGATPKSGDFSCYWDCTGMDGQPVPEGIYHIFVEGTLRGENRVLYSAEMNLGTEASQTTAEAAYFGDSEKERGMLGTVTVRYHPLKRLSSPNTLISENDVLSTPSMHADGNKLDSGVSLPDIRNAPAATYHYRMVRDEISDHIWAEYPLFYGPLDMQGEINKAVTDLVYKLFPPYEEIPFEQYMVKAEVKLCNERIISIVLWYKEYSSGSTWALSKQLSLNYDLKTGREIRLGDIYDVENSVKDPSQLEINVDDYINLQRAVIKKEYAVPQGNFNEDSFNQALSMSRVILSDFDKGNGVTKLDIAETSHFSYFTEDKLGLIVAAYPRGCHVFEIPYEVAEPWAK